MHRRGHLHAALSPGGQGRNPVRRRLAADADDGRCLRHVDCQRPDHQSDRSLSPVSDRRHCDHDAGARAGPRYGDASAGAGGAERHRLSRTGGCDIWHDAVPVHRRFGRRIALRRHFRRQPGKRTCRSTTGGMAPPNATDPSAIGALPLELRGIYLDVFTTALHPVFLLAAALGAMAFALTWPLKEEPLRGPARSETVAEIFVAPRDATSVEELEAILNQLQRRENRWAVIQRMARTLAVPLAPDEIWLLVQLCRERTALQSAGLGDRLGIPRARIDDIADRLTTAGLIARAPDGSLNRCRRRPAGIRSYGRVLWQPPGAARRQPDVG
jgi:hypothetical protein